MQGSGLEAEASPEVQEFLSDVSMSTEYVTSYLMG